MGENKRWQTNAKYHLWINFQLNLALMSLWVEPMKAKTEITKQIMLKTWRTTHFLVQASIFFCPKYIWNGKYIDIGQKLKAPKTPNTWLKYGNSNAIPVVDTTYAVRKHSLKIFNSKAGRHGSFILISFVYALSGYLLLNHFSTNSNTGWLYTLRKNIMELFRVSKHEAP